MENELRHIALEKLLLAPSKESLFELIRWLDLVCSEESVDSLPMQILTRSVIAAGRGLVTRQAYPAVVKTIQAAEAYCLAPTEVTFDRYFEAASNSYPFGTGQGCYTVKGLGYAECEPGSGCTSGAGTLDQVAYTIGAEEVMRLIAEEVVPWLKGEGDPIVECSEG